MEYEKQITRMKNLYDNLYQFINDENNFEEDFHTLINNIKSEKYFENIDEFKSILHIINKISKNHHRYSAFLPKIEKVLLFYSDEIKKSFSNSELFNIFQSNKIVLLFLIENKIVIIDDYVINSIINKDSKFKQFYVQYFESQYQDEFVKKTKKSIEKQKLIHKNYSYYFYPEIKQFLDESKRNEIENKIPTIDENFENDRKSGENDLYICQIIRQDLIDEFVIYENKNILPLSIKIKPSIFETNPFLMKNEPTLIEYAAFYGSIQIFRYLLLNHVELSKMLWLYAIHGNNPEIIHILEENRVKPDDNSYLECLKESLKCHHNEIANYIIDNLMEQKFEKNQNDFFENKVAFGFKYHNYIYIQNFYNYQSIFYYACLYDYLSIVKLLAKLRKINFNEDVI